MPGKSAGRLGNLRYTPLQQLLHSADRGGKQREVRALAHVESPRPIVIILVIKNQTREIAGIGSYNPIFFQRRSSLPFWRNIQKADRIRPQQPFVGGRPREIRLHFVDVDRQRSERLGKVES